MIHWLHHILGLDSSNSPFYLFPSGAFSYVAVFSFFWALLLFYRKNNCKRAWCPFIGHHPFTDPKDGVTRMLCWLHHPDVLHRALKPHHIAAIHARRQAAADEHNERRV